MIRINLLPVKAAQKKEKLRGQLVILTLTVILVLAACSAVYVSLLGKISSVEQEIAQQEEEINRLRKVIGEVSRFKKLQQELQGKLDVLDKLKEGKVGPVHLLDELSGAMPEKVWVTNLKETSGAITIAGVGLNEESVAEFLRHLEESPYYKGVELQVVEQVSQGGLKLQKFDVTCRSETPPKSSLR